MKSLLYQGVTPFTVPTACVTPPCRTEVPLALRWNGRIYRFTLRDKVIPEDPYLMMVKATAFSIANQEPYNGRAPDRSIRDFLIRSNIQI